MSASDQLWLGEIAKFFMEHDVSGEKKVVGTATGEEVAELRDLQARRASIDESLAVAIRVHSEEYRRLRPRIHGIFDTIFDRLDIKRSYGKTYSVDQETNEVTES